MPSSLYAEEMAQLNANILGMAAHAEGAVANAMRALLDVDTELARRVIDGDGALDKLEIDTDEVAVHLFTKAPLATDLRFVTVAMKISSNLERVGDEAVKIARRVVDLSAEPQLPILSDLGRMADLSIKMLHDALAAFVQREPAKARAIPNRDAEVDELNRKVYRELVQMMSVGPVKISRCLNLMVISKSLERIADHATNLAEEVVYLYEGVDIRHLGSKLRQG